MTNKVIANIDVLCVQLLRGRRLITPYIQSPLWRQRHKTACSNSPKETNAVDLSLDRRQFCPKLLDGKDSDEALLVGRDSLLVFDVVDRVGSSSSCLLAKMRRCWSGGIPLLVPNIRTSLSTVSDDLMSDCLDGEDVEDLHDIMIKVETTGNPKPGRSAAFASFACQRYFHASPPHRLPFTVATILSSRSDLDAMDAVQHVSPRKGRIPTEKQFISLVPSKRNGAFTHISARKAQVPHFKRNPDGIPSDLDQKAKAMRKARMDSLFRARITKRDVPNRPSISGLNGEFGDLNDANRSDGGFGDSYVFDSEGHGADDESDGDADDENDGYDGESLETTRPERSQQPCNSRTSTRKRSYAVNQANLQRNWDTFVLAVTGRLAITSSQSPLCTCSNVVELPSISFHGMTLLRLSKRAGFALKSFVMCGNDCPFKDGLPGLLREHYFPSSPKGPTYAIHEDILELFHLLKIPKSRFCQALQAFIETRKYTTTSSTLAEAEPAGDFWVL